MTTQTPETVTYRSSDLPMVSLPLEPLLDRLGDPPVFAVPNTGLQRGYQAAWSIDDGELRLLSMTASVRVLDRVEPFVGWAGFCVYPRHGLLVPVAPNAGFVDDPGVERGSDLHPLSGEYLAFNDHAVLVGFTAAEAEMLRMLETAVLRVEAIRERPRSSAGGPFAGSSVYEFPLFEGVWVDPKRVPLNALRKFWIAYPKDGGSEFVPPWRLARTKVLGSHGEEIIADSLRGFCWSGVGDRRHPLDKLDTFREVSQRACGPADLGLDSLPATATWFSGELLVAAEPGMPVLDSGGEVSFPLMIRLGIEGGIVASESAVG